MEEVVFLCYMNRSGSTLLARLLDGYSEIGVSPEARIPDGIVYGPIELETISDVERFLERLYSDYKFRAWNVDRNVLRKKIAGVRFPVRFDTLLQVILAAYFDHQDTWMYIYKCPYIKHIKAARRVFPDNKFIFLLRDIRGIYNSQKKAIDSTTGGPMSDNPVTTAVLFKQVSSIVDRLREDDRFHVVRYEDLVGNTDDELRRILAFLGVSSKQSFAGKSYLKKIVPEQRHLHPNVEFPPLVYRIWAWRDELTRLEIMTLQEVARAELVKNGYELIDLGNISFADRMGYYLFWLRHFGRIFRKIAVGIRMWLRSPQLFKKDHVHLVAPNFSRTVHAFMSRLRSLGK